MNVFNPIFSKRTTPMIPNESHGASYSRATRSDECTVYTTRSGQLQYENVPPEENQYEIVNWLGTCCATTYIMTLEVEWLVSKSHTIFTPRYINFSVIWSLKNTTVLSSRKPDIRAMRLFSSSSRFRDFMRSDGKISCRFLNTRPCLREKIRWSFLWFVLSMDVMIYEAT